MDVKKGNYLKNQDIEGVAFSFSKNKENFYIIDSNNNVMSVSNNNNLEVLPISEINYDNYLSVICGIEDERYEHQDKDSYKNALTWELEDNANLLLKIINEQLKKYNKNYKDILYVFLNCNNKIVVDIGFELVLK